MYVLLINWVNLTQPSQLSGSGWPASYYVIIHGFCVQLIYVIVSRKISWPFTYLRVKNLLWWLNLINTVCFENITRVCGVIYSRFNETPTKGVLVWFESRFNYPRWVCFVVSVHSSKDTRRVCLLLCFVVVWHHKTRECLGLTTNNKGVCACLLSVNTRPWDWSRDSCVSVTEGGTLWCLCFA